MPRKKSGNFDQSKYIQEYQKQTYKRYSFQVRKEEKALIDWINSHSNKQAYIINLIRSDMERNK